jgi:hypothetical protein
MNMLWYAAPETARAAPASKAARILGRRICQITVAKRVGFSLSGAKRAFIASSAGMAMVPSLSDAKADRTRIRINAVITAL